MSRKSTMIKRLLGKASDRHRPSSCPAIQSSAVINPLSRKLEARDELSKRKHASYAAGDLARVKQESIMSWSRTAEKTVYEVKLSPQVADEGTSEKKNDAKYFAENMARFYGFGIVFVASVDSSFLQETNSGAFATLLISYVTPEEHMPHRIPAEMYERLLDQGSQFHGPGQLPTGFQSGYSRVFGSGRVRFIFTWLARNRVECSQHDLVALVEDAESLVQAVTSQPFWI